MLLHEITRCPNIISCFETSNINHPCFKIIHNQDISDLSGFQIPEPWNGRIETAPILFLSSNPSISTEEEYPVWEWDDDLIHDFFQYRFGGGSKEWVKDGLFHLNKDGSHSHEWTRFWAAVRKRAMELLEREATPGVDYALSEVVHCKSRLEVGVGEAVEACTQRYLRRIIEHSGARVIVCLGKFAAAAVGKVFGIPEKINIFGPVRIGEMERVFAFLPHPNARGVRSFGECLEARELEMVRERLR